MDQLLHSLLLWPIQAGVEVLFEFLLKLTLVNVGVTVVLLSLVVNTLVLPLFLVADRWQKEEREILDRVKPKADRIRSAFRGDERQMLLMTHHRQMGYRPFYALRSSVGLLMQIPFFLAAYLVLSHSDNLRGSSFFFLKDLSSPDGLLTLGGLKLNVLPVVMTAVNILSAVVYVRSARLKDLGPLLAMALVFLLLLYTSPAGLVLYWTVSNLFSLAKNLIGRTKRPARWFHGASLLILGLLVWWAFGIEGPPRARAWLFGAAAAAVALTPWLWRRAFRLLGASGPVRKPEFQLFLASGALLALLAGAALPALLMASSPQEFPGGLGGVIRSLMQGLGLFLLLPLGLWALAPGPVRRLLAWGGAAAASAGLLYAFALPPEVSLNASFTFIDPGRLGKATPALWSAAVAGAVVVVLGALVWTKREAWLAVVLGVSAAALGVMAVTSAAALPAAPVETAAAGEIQPVFALSKTGPNLFLIFLDGLSGEIVPEALESVPGLRDQLDGFTWYQNTVSYSYHTLFTVPAMVGGFTATPEAINARPGVPLAEKVDEAWLRMPSALARQKYETSITDPSVAGLQWIPDTRIFDQIPGVTARNIKESYRQIFLRQNHLLDDVPATQAFEYDIFLRASLLRMAPPPVRPGIYFNGSWWKSGPTAVFSSEVGSYAGLRALAQLCRVTDGAPRANFFFNEVNHDPGAFTSEGKLSRFPIVIPDSDLAKFGDDFSVKYVYGARAALGGLRDWLTWLRAQGLADRTRVVVVADHGRPLSDQHFSTHARFHPILLVKDFDAHGPLKTDRTLKTNADVPALLMAGLPDAPPGRPAGDQPVVYDGPFNPFGQAPDRFLLTPLERLTGPDSYNPADWTKVTP